jgi:hypothetical protein
MNEIKVIERIAEKVTKDLEKEGSGHDWWHVYRFLPQCFKRKRRIANKIEDLHILWKFSSVERYQGGAIWQERIQLEF